jgi:uracil-DNA glycosylase
VPGRAGADRDPASAASFVPASGRLDVRRRAALAGTGCRLHADATQTVFGRGARDAALVLVGEKPGDVEDRKGVPFVGPAGGVLRRCLAAAGADGHDVYVTNAVKHFKHERRGTRRLHRRPTADEIDACHPWLAAELGALTGHVIVALGVAAARALLGRSITVAATRGQWIPLGERVVLVTYHPSAVLRSEERSPRIETDIVHDLATAWSWTSSHRRAHLGTIDDIEPHPHGTGTR